MHKTIARLVDASRGTLLTLKHTQCFDKSKILGTSARVTALPETVTNAKHFPNLGGGICSGQTFAQLLSFEQLTVIWERLRELRTPGWP